MTDMMLDFEVEAPTLEFLMFPGEQTADNGGKCSVCHASLKGCYTRHHGGRDHGEYFAICDDCTEGEWASRNGGEKVTGPMWRTRKKLATAALRPTQPQTPKGN